ncbi:hypothetical protein [Thermus tengchongensis]|uniref:hypothetical protein n=1 Tax=Thermus tengchongensis TaxID=1214928 RepID=UPI001F304620|nr:hypothetical protein [Thermus tengchongensis]
MNTGEVLLGVAALGAVGVGALVALRLTSPERAQVPNPYAAPVQPPASSPVLPPAYAPAQPQSAAPAYPAPAPVYPAPPPSTPTITKGQLCAEYQQKKANLETLIQDTQKKMDALVAKGSSADKNCWSYAQREACFFGICSPALNGNYSACMSYVKGEGPRPGNLFDFEDSRAVDQAHREYAALKEKLADYQSQLEAVRQQLNKLAAEGVVC